MNLCAELGGMTLAEMDRRMGAGELIAWKAKSQIESFVQKTMRARKVSQEEALDFARADHRSVLARKERRRKKT